MFENYEKRVKKKFDEMSPCLDSVSGLKRVLIEDLIMDLCNINVQLEDVRNESILKNGPSWINEKGKTERNPEIMTQHQLISEKSSIISKIFMHLPDSADTDAIAAFVAR